MPDIIINDSNFDEKVLDVEGPVLVDFSADWCGPCQMQGPIIEELEKDMENEKAKVFKVDVDESPKTAERYEIMSIPTLIIFQKGEVKEILHGVHSKDDLKEKLAEMM